MMSSKLFGNLKGFLWLDPSKDTLGYITTLSGGVLVNNWLAREQQMLRDIGFSVFCRFNSKPT